MTTFPTDAEREAVAATLGCKPSAHDAACLTHNDPGDWGNRGHWLDCADAILDALAPHVADRERAAAARALRDMADDLASITHGRTSEALAHWPDYDRGIYELAIEEASGKIHERADEMEAGEDRG